MAETKQLSNSQIVQELPGPGASQAATEAAKYFGIIETWRARALRPSHDSNEPVELQVRQASP